MARIDLPTLAEVQALQTRCTDLEARVAILESAPASQAAGIVQLNSFPGSTADARLTAALTYCASQTRPPYIQFPTGVTTLNQGGRVPFTGMRLIGPNSPGPKIEALSSPVPWGPPYSGSAGASTRGPGGGNHLISLGSGITTGTNSLFHSTSSIYSIYVGNLSFTCTGRQAQFWSQTGGSVYGGQFHSLSFWAMAAVFGNSSASQKMLNTQCVFDGHWTVISQNAGAMPFHFGGSDSEFWNGASFLNLEGDSGNGSFSIWFDAQEKSNVGRIYNTNKDGWRGIRVTGNSDGLTFHGTTAEGRNADTPCHGSVFRIEGGNVAINDPWIAFGMAAPSSFGSATPTGNSGMIDHRGGDLLVMRPNYERANGVLETVPLISSSGGRLTARHAAAVGSWSGRPRVQITGTSIADVDSSLQVV